MDVTEPCALDQHRTCKALEPGQDPHWAGKFVAVLNGTPTAVGDCECYCHGVSPELREHAEQVASRFQ